MPFIELDRIERASRDRRILLIVEINRYRVFLSAFLRVRGCVVAAYALMPPLGEVALFDPDVIVLSAPIAVEYCESIKADGRLTLIPIVVLLPRSGPGVGSSLWKSAIACGAIDCKLFPIGHDELEIFDLRLKGFADQKRVCEELEHVDRVIVAISLMVEARDPNTGDHCHRLYNAGLRFAEFLELNRNDTRSLALAGFLHDIGKLGVRDAVLLKPGKLSPEDWESMRQHPLIGELLCQPLRSMQGVLPIIRHHHERQDGSGYPDGLTGDRVPFLAQAFQLLDIMDALLYDRPYKSAMPLEQVLGILDDEVRQGWRNPDLVAKVKEFATLFFARPE